jgi:glycosyltransferase involved in cell wall biosynthesis
MGASPQPLLSIVVPFHNSIGKMDYLASSLRALQAADVECIFVDDGSTDDTRNRLDELKASMSCPCTLLVQPNKGCGAARNRGLAHARGKYVWFVDSDDDINLEAIAVLRRVHEANYDFIDFGVTHYAADSGPVRPSRGARAGALLLDEGEYTAEDVTRLFLLKSVGWIWTKLFRRDFLQARNLTFAEYCFYEDLPWLFWLPLLVDRFYKSGVIAYYHHQEQASITRTLGRRPRRFYDRLLTASLSVERLKDVAATPPERMRIEDKFTSIFLVHTAQMLRESGEWGMIVRVVRLYREEMTRLGLSRRAARRAMRKMPLLLPLWLVSYCYPSQSQFFRNTHRQAWNMCDIVLAPARLAKGPARP